MADDVADSRADETADKYAHIQANGGADTSADGGTVQLWRRCQGVVPCVRVRRFFIS